MSGGSVPGGPAGRWLAITLLAPAPGEALLLVEALRRLGARAVEREAQREWGREGRLEEGMGARLLALFPAPADPDRLAADVAIAVRANTSLGIVVPRWRWIDHDEWVARWGGGHPTRRVSDRLAVVVGGPGGAEGAGGFDRVVRLEPSSAFGTAEHPTTRACLRMLDEVVRDGDRVLDVGSGSGVLAIAAVVLGAASAVALEADPVACSAARRNAKLNEASDRVDLREVAVVPGSLGAGGPFDGVVANIGANVLRPLLPDLASVLAPAGWLLLSGATPREREDLVDAARATGLEVADEEVLEGWWTVRLARPFGATRGGS